jgi:hypothetical protein
MEWPMRLGLLAGVLLCSQAGAVTPANVRDPLVWSHLVVRGVVTSVTEPSLPIKEYRPASQMQTGNVSVRLIRVRVLEVLKGEYSSEMLDVWDDDDHCGYVVGLDTVVACVDFAPYILTGAYRVPTGRSVFVERDGYSVRPGGRFADVPPPSENGAAVSPESLAEELLTLAQLRARVAQSSPRAVALQADVVAIGTVSSVEDSTSGPPFIVKVTMDVQSALKGEVPGHLTFLVERGLSSFYRGVYTFEIPEAGETWCVFVRQRDGVLYSFAGGNGLLRIDGTKLIVDGVVAHGFSLPELRDAVEETVR